VSTEEESGPSSRGRAWQLAGFAALVIVAVAFSSYVRLNQYQEWKRVPERYFVDDRPLMTSTDAYYWLRLAEEHRDGVYSQGEMDPLQSFPDGARRLRPVPLLSVLVARASPLWDGDLVRTGIYVVPLLAGLFIIPLGLYFRRLDLPAVGLLGGLVASFGHEYFTRTSIGGVDTDVLNLLFPFTGSLFVLLAGEAESDRRTLIYSALAGLTMLGFYWWYYHPGFTVVYLVLLLAYLALARKPARTIALSATLFAIVSNPVYLWRGLAGVLEFAQRVLLPSTTSVVTGSFSVPDVTGTVAEFQRVPAADTLRLVLESPVLTAGGLALFAICALRFWRKLLPLAPILLLGLIAFTGGKRFAMFLGPFVGVGYGYLITILASWLLRRWKTGPRYRSLVIYGAAGLFFVSISGATAIGFVPVPTLSSRTISSIAAVGDRLPEATPVLSWWDYGYALQDIGGLATYQDGSYHGVETYVIARSLSATAQDELHATTAYLTSLGAAGLRDALDATEAPRSVLAEVGSYAGRLQREDVHLAFFEAMISKYAAIHYLGTWDFDLGRGTADGYERIRCASWDNDKLHCAGMVIDTRTGFARADLSLERLVVIRDGRVLFETGYPSDTDVFLQVLTNERGAYDFYLLTQRVYESNFNQMYFLGRYDESRFELVYSDFPAARLFRLK